MNDQNLPLILPTWTPSGKERTLLPSDPESVRVRDDWWKYLAGYWRGKGDIQRTNRPGYPDRYAIVLNGKEEDLLVWKRLLGIGELKVRKYTAKGKQYERSVLEVRHQHLIAWFLKHLIPYLFFNCKEENYVYTVLLQRPDIYQGTRQRPAWSLERSEARKRERDIRNNRWGY